MKYFAQKRGVQKIVFAHLVDFQLLTVIIAA